MRQYLLAIALSCAMVFPALAQDVPPQQAARSKSLPPVSSLLPVPEDMQQRWILNSCDSGELSYRFSRRYLMISIPGWSDIVRLGGFSDLGNGRYKMTLPDEATGLLLGSDGRLIQYFGDINISFSRAALEARQLMIPHVLYENCTTAENIKVDEDPLLLSLLPSLDTVQESCAAPQDIAKASCQKSIFSLFDADKDDALDESEMKRGWDILMSYSAFGACTPEASAPDSLQGDGDAYIHWIFENLDRDQDKKITFSDFAPRWKEMQAHPLMSGLTNLLISADSKAGILPQDVKLTCVNCCVSGKL